MLYTVGMSNIITSLQIQQKDKTRINVFLDEQFAFGVGIDIAANLHKGQQLSAAEIEQLQQTDERGRAYNKALYYLGFRPRSRAEIEKYLTEKEHPADVIEHVVQRLIEQKYLDDESFARMWVDQRERFRPTSARALRFELRQKGVDRNVIDEVVEEVDDEAAAWAALEPKVARWQGLEQVDFIKKATGFLARRGFSYDVTRRVCKRAWTLVADGQPQTDDELLDQMNDDTA